MKKILVPVDYSMYSNNAVHYAIAIAKTVHADIHLCHALEIAELSHMAGVMMWPMENFSELKEDSDEDLRAFIDQLKKDIELSTPHFPKLTFSSKPGSVKQVIDQLISEEHIDLVVMGLAGAGGLDRFLLGSKSKDIIEKTIVPVLLVPKESNYSPFKKIAFATDLSECDLNSIHAIARLFALYDPEILLTHVDGQPSDFHDPLKPANVFLNRVTCKLNYSKIYFRHVNASDVEEGLEWLTHHGQIDMLAMVHRRTSTFSRILNGSHTQKLAKTIKLPLLVMPEDRTQIGW